MGSSGTQNSKALLSLDGVGEKKGNDAAYGGDGQNKTGKGMWMKHVSGTQVGFIPHNNSKVNQDRPLTVGSFCEDDEKALFGCFDGHGVNGHDVSEHLIKVLPINIAKEKTQLIANPKKTLSKVFVRTNRRFLDNTSGIDTTCSGSTAVVCYMNGKQLITANSGDSRAVMGVYKNGKIVAEALSIDQKPELASEKKRIIEAGGRVKACEDMDGNPIGPLRVWLKQQNIPGLAMTRSFGDGLAASVGVTAKPDIMERQMTDNDAFIILASDGVWEFVTNQEAVDIVAKYKDPKEAVDELIKKSTWYWKQEEDVIDDITAVIVYLKGYKEEA